MSDATSSRTEAPAAVRSDRGANHSFGVLSMLLTLHLYGAVRPGPWSSHRVLRIDRDAAIVARIGRNTAPVVVLGTAGQLSQRVETVGILPRRNVGAFVAHRSVGKLPLKVGFHRNATLWRHAHFRGIRKLALKVGAHREFSVAMVRALGYTAVDIRTLRHAT